MKDITLILIDPQKGFCSPSGSLGMAHGSDEIDIIQQVLPRLPEALANSKKTYLIMSEYSPGQFTSGDLSHKLAQLCVPEKNRDCHLIDELSFAQFDAVFTKNHQSALTSSEFAAQIKRDLESGVTTFVLGGFLLEHCVQATAKDLVDYFRPYGAELMVCSELTASRKQKYIDGSIDSTISALESLGIAYKPWSKI